jgi:FkbM family methyltransferase
MEGIMDNTKKYPWENYASLPLTKRISRKLRKLAGRNARFKIGKNIMEVPEDMIMTFFDNGDYFEKNVSYWLEKVLSSTKNKVYYDVGANYGYFCLTLAPKASHVYAFEPVSRTNDILLRNIKRNKLSNITVYKLGLSDKKSNMKINLYRSSGHNSLFLRDSLKADPNNLVGQEVIDLVTLDDLIQEENLNPPDLIKIDIEGGELYALRGAREVIKKYQPVLVIEYLEIEKIYRDIGCFRSDLLTELESHNYVIYGIAADFTDLTVYPIAKFDEIEITNIIALPKNMEDIILEASELRTKSDMGIPLVRDE